MIVSIQNVPKSLENVRKTWNLKMRISTKPFYKLFSVVHVNFQWMCLIIERIIWWSYPSKMIPKPRKFAKNLKLWKFEYRAKSFYTRCSVWFTTTRYALCLIIEMNYVDRMTSKCPQQLRKCAKNEKLNVRISTKAFYKLFSTVHNYWLWMFLIIERIYEDCIHPKCPQKLRKSAKNLKPEIANIH